jgi:hypothetical protein
MWIADIKDGIEKWRRLFGPLITLLDRHSKILTEKFVFFFYSYMLMCISKLRKKSTSREMAWIMYYFFLSSRSLGKTHSWAFRIRSNQSNHVKLIIYKGLWAKIVLYVFNYSIQITDEVSLPQEEKDFLALISFLGLKRCLEDDHKKYLDET